MYQRILVPVDGSPTSQRGLNEAIELAKITKGCLRMLHVIDDLSFSLALDAYSGHPGEWMKQLRDGGGRILDAAKATAEAAGVEADTLLCDRVIGPVYEQVTTEANNWHADLIVLGTHGRRGIDRFVMAAVQNTSCVMRAFPCCWCAHRRLPRRLSPYRTASRCICPRPRSRSNSRAQSRSSTQRLYTGG